MHGLGHLETGQFLAQVGDQRLARKPRFRLDERDRQFPASGIGQANDRCGAHARVAFDLVFDLARVNVEAAADDQLLQPSDDAVDAVSESYFARSPLRYQRVPSGSIANAAAVASGSCQ